MAKGDHIYVTRPLGYTHHGIDCGDGTVIHFTGEPGNTSKAAASIARSMLADFALDSIVHVRDYKEKDEPQVVISRAESKLGSTDYHLVTNNCEHFATWCCTGRTASQQVRMVSSLTTSGAATATSLGTTAGVVGAVGSVAGLSGAGVMSGLGTAGGIIGAGAAAGPLVIATLPAAVSIGAIQVGLPVATRPCRRRRTTPDGTVELPLWPGLPRPVRAAWRPSRAWAPSPGPARPASPVVWPPSAGS